MAFWKAKSFDKPTPTKSSTNIDFDKLKVGDIIYNSKHPDEWIGAVDGPHWIEITRLRGSSIIMPNFFFFTMHYNDVGSFDGAYDEAGIKRLLRIE